METYIGFTGLPGAGKTEAIGILRHLASNHGILVFSYSLSDEVSDELLIQGLPITRDNKVQIANQLRADNGSGILARRVISSIKDQLALGGQNKHLIFLIDAIRTPGEVEELRSHFGRRFVLIAIDAPQEVIVQRLMERKRFDESPEVVRDPKQAANLLLKENASGEMSGINVRSCIDIADLHLWNNGSLDKLREIIKICFHESLLPLVNS
jgi:dephospho-CoA kinase